MQYEDNSNPSSTDGCGQPSSLYGNWFSGNSKERGASDLKKKNEVDSESIECGISGREKGGRGNLDRSWLIDF